MREYMLSEIKSSRMMYDRKPPKMMTVAVLVIALMILGVGVWGAVNQKTEVVKTTGMISSDDKGYAMSQISGTIAEVLSKEGEKVRVGETILRIDSKEAVSEASIYKKAYEMYNDLSDKYSVAINKMSYYDVTKPAGSVVTNNNPFDKETDYSMYLSYQTYLDEIKIIEDQSSLQTIVPGHVKELIDRLLNDMYSALSQNQSSYLQNKSQMDYYGNLDNYYSVAISVLSGYDPLGMVPENPFDPSVSYHDHYFFQSVLDSLSSEPDQVARSVIKTNALSNYLNLKSQNDQSLGLYSAQTEHFSKMKGGYESAITALKGFDHTKEVNTVPQNGNPFSESDGQFHALYESTLGAIRGEWDKYDTIASEQKSIRNLLRQAVSAFNDSRIQYDLLYVQNKDRYEHLATVIEGSTFCAKMEGYIHFITDLRPGMVVSAGQGLFTISSELTDENSLVTFYLPSGSRAYVREGNRVNISFKGIDRTEYGSIGGEVKFISVDSSVDSSGNIVYECRVKPDSINFVNNNGKSISAVNGMLAEVNVQYEQSTWTDWALRQIGIKT